MLVKLVQASLIKTASFYHTQPYGKTHECTLYTHVTFYFPNTYLCTHADKLITSHTQRLL